MCVCVVIVFVCTCVNIGFYLLGVFNCFDFFCLRLRYLFFFLYLGVFGWMRSLLHLWLVVYSCELLYICVCCWCSFECFAYLLVFVCLLMIAKRITV